MYKSRNQFSFSSPTSLATSITHILVASSTGDSSLLLPKLANKFKQVSITNTCSLLFQVANINILMVSSLYP